MLYTGLLETLLTNYLNYFLKLPSPSSAYLLNSNWWVYEINICAISSLKRTPRCWEQCTQIQYTLPALLSVPSTFFEEGKGKKGQAWGLASILMVPVHLLDPLGIRLSSLRCMTNSSLNFSSRMASVDVRRNLFRRHVYNKLNHPFSKGTKIADRVSFTA
jgi:hypothetical protein